MSLGILQWCSGKHDADTWYGRHGDSRVSLRFECSIVVQCNKQSAARCMFANQRAVEHTTFHCFHDGNISSEWCKHSSWISKDEARLQWSSFDDLLWCDIFWDKLKSCLCQRLRVMNTSWYRSTWCYHMIMSMFVSDVVRARAAAICMTSKSLSLGRTFSRVVFACIIRYLDRDSLATKNTQCEPERISKEIRHKHPQKPDRLSMGEPFVQPLCSLLEWVSPQWHVSILSSKRSRRFQINHQWASSAEIFLTLIIMAFSWWIISSLFAWLNTICVVEHNNSTPCERRASSTARSFSYLNRIDQIRLWTIVVWHLNANRASTLLIWRYRIPYEPFQVSHWWSGGACTWRSRGGVADINGISSLADSWLSRSTFDWNSQQSSRGRLWKPSLCAYSADIDELGAIKCCFEHPQMSN